MSAANMAKTARARASIAARILKTAKTWEQGGYGLGRNFDDCFENGDGEQVYRLLMAKAQTDDDLRRGMIRQGYRVWLQKAGLPTAL